MNIRREVLQGSRIPPWHRIAYRDFFRDCAVAYPIGLHIVVKLCRRVWEWSYRYRPSRLEQMLADIRKFSYREGHVDGYITGYRDGLERGEEKGRELAEAERNRWDAFFQNIKRG